MSDIDLDPTSVPAEFVKEGADWLAVFSPRIPRVMDVALAAKFAHDKVVCSVRFSPDGARIAVGLDGSVLVYDVASGAQIILPVEHEGEPPARNYVRSVAFSPDGRFLASGSEDTLIRLWNIDSQEIVHILSGHRREVYSVEFAPGGQTLISGSGDRTLRVWDISTAAPPSPIIFVVPTDATKPDTGITALAVSPDGRRLAAGALNGTLRLWDISGSEGKVIAEWEGHTKGVYSVRFVLHGSGLVSASLDRTLKRWDLGDRPECVKTLEGHKDYVLAGATVQEGQMIRAASASRDGTVRLWDLRTGETQFLIQGHRNAVTSVDLSHDGKYLVSGSGDGEARIWKYSVM